MLAITAFYYANADVPGLALRATRDLLRPGLRVARSRWLIVAAISALLAAGSPAAAPTLAQAGCLTDAEPNDTEAEASPVRGAFCVEGTLPGGDQDLALWEVGDEDLRTRWRITLEGVPGTLTILQFFQVTSPPGQTPVAVNSVPVLDVNVAPDQVDPTVVDDQLLPVGRYLVGASRSDLPGGGEPTVFEYGVRVESGLPFPSLQEIEPNDDEATATAVADAFEAGGDLAGSSYDTYAWTVTEPGRWDVQVRAPLEQTVSLEVTAADGRRIGNASGHGATLYDRALEPGHVRRSARSDGRRSPPVRPACRADGGAGRPRAE